MPIACYDPATSTYLGTLRSAAATADDLNALTGTQKTNIWNDFTSGTPAKWTLDDGPNNGALLAMTLGATDLVTGLLFSLGLQTQSRMKMVAIYLQDRPLYLVNPAFDTSINVKPYIP